jgi:hypothetical protein
LGEPINARVEVGSATKVRVFSREFERGFVYLSLQKTGFSGNDPIPIETSEPFKVYAVDGNLSGPFTTFTLNEGDGLVLIREVIVPPPPPPPPPPPGGGGGPGGIWQDKLHGFHFAPWPKNPFRRDPLRNATKNWRRASRDAFKKP